MELQLFGINHKTSNVFERENFIINESNQIILDDCFKKNFGDDINSFFGISTCNRTEIYLLGKADIAREALVLTIKELNIKNIQQDSYYFLDKEDAFIHMCKVASGIDSQVLGEQEIFGQFKKAIKVAKDLMILKPSLNYFCNKAFEIVKRVRTNTGIGLNSLSVSGLSLKLVKKIFEKPQLQNILIIGAGSLAHSIVENLYNNDVSNIRAINRSIRNIKVTDDYEIISSSLDNLHYELEKADIVISSASSEVPLIGKGAVESCLKARKNKPLLIIDLAVPRNVEEEVKFLEHCYLFTIDDIEKITQENYGQRTIEAEKAINMIVIDSQDAINEINDKFIKDNLQNQLHIFINSLSDEHKDELMNTKNTKKYLLNILDEKKNKKFLIDLSVLNELESHIIKSMIKRQS